jgi:hypothetical protein
MHKGPLGPTEPDIGDIVHYQSRGSADGKFAPACVAAVVTACQGLRDGVPIAGLAVLNPAGLFFHAEAPQDETRSDGGTWHWTHRGDR